MLKIIPPLLLTCLCQLAPAQSREYVKRLEDMRNSPGVFYLPAHTQLRDVPWRDSIYLFSAFRPAKITFGTGHSPEGSMLLNYDLYRGQMDMINNEGDTMQVKPSKEVKLITIGDQIFFYDYKIGYLQVEQRLPVALAALKLMITTHMMYVSGKIDSGTDDVDLRGTPSVNDRYYRKGEYYYFISIDNKVYKPSRSSAIKLFNKHKHEVSKYIKTNRTDFNKKADLVNLLLYCHSLNTTGK